MYSRTKLLAYVTFIILFKTCLAGIDVCGNVVDWLYPRATVLNTTKNTLADEIKSDEKSSEALRKIVEFHEHFEQERIRRKKSIKCNIEPGGIHELWKTANIKSKAFGHGEIDNCAAYVNQFCVESREESCPSGVNDNARKQAIKLFGYVDTLKALYEKVGSSVMKGYGFNWTQTFSDVAYYYDESSDYGRKCDIRQIMAFRVRNKWAIEAVVQNSSVTEEVGDWERTSLREHVIFTQNGPSSLDQSYPVCDGKPDKEFKNETLLYYINGTANMEQWSGITTWSTLGDTEKLENPALQFALETSAHPKETVQDAGTASSLAIIFLPSVLAIFPIGLYEDVSLKVAMIYVLATDIVSVLPVAIKGIELIAFGRTNYYGLFSHAHGKFSGNKTVASETWIARCKLKPRVGRLGVTLVILAFLIMFLGVLFEVFVLLWLKKLKASWLEFAEQNDVPVDERNEKAGLLWHISNYRSNMRNNN